MKIIAKALLKNPDGQLLLLHRSGTHPHYPHHLDLPGGEVDAGEEASMAVVREVNEETGIRVAQDSLVLLFDKIVNNDRCILYVGTIPKDAPITLS